MTDDTSSTKPPPPKPDRIPVRIYCERRFGPRPFPEVLRQHIHPSSSLPSHWQRDCWKSELCAEHNAEEVELDGLEISGHSIGVGVLLPLVDYWEYFDDDSGRIDYPDGRCFIAVNARPIMSSNTAAPNPAPPPVPSPAAAAPPAAGRPQRAPRDWARADLLYQAALGREGSWAWSTEAAFNEARDRFKGDPLLGAISSRRRRDAWNIAKWYLERGLRPSVGWDRGIVPDSFKEGH